MQKKTEIIAHRGFSGKAPENTMAAFRKALGLGVDGIELDIHLSNDGQLAVIHDEDVSRTTDGKGLVENMSSEELRNLDAGNWFSGKFRGERIPFLEEVMQLVSGSVTLWIEIKKGSRLYSGIEQKAIALIEKYRAEQWCVLHSFEPEVLENISSLRPGLPVFYTLELASPRIFENFIRSPLPRLSNAKGFNVNHDAIDADCIKAAGERNMKVLAWTVNEEKDLREMLEMGVDGIISNYPDKAKKAAGL